MRQIPLSLLLFAIVLNGCSFWRSISKSDSPCNMPMAVNYEAGVPGSCVSCRYEGIYGCENTFWWQNQVRYGAGGFFNFDKYATNTFYLQDPQNRLAFKTAGAVSPYFLPIAPVTQETKVWCWLAVGEMNFKYYNIPTVNNSSYQCGILSAFAYNLPHVRGNGGACHPCHQNCFNCIVPAGDISTFEKMINHYPAFACKSIRNKKAIEPKIRKQYSPGAAPYSPQQIIKAIRDDASPVIAAINPSGTFSVGTTNAEHVAMIVGYYYDIYNRFILVVNDPYPFWIEGFNPYSQAEAVAVAPGRYHVPYVSFTNRMLWRIGFNFI
jgi:hypothetical protein